MDSNTPTTDLTTDDEIGQPTPVVLPDAATPVAETPVVAEPTLDLTDSSSETPPPPPGFLRPNAEHQYATNNPAGTGSVEKLNLPPASEKDILDRLGKLPNTDLSGSEKQRDWVAALRDGISYLPMQGMYVDRLYKEGSAFKQVITHQGQHLRGVTPTFKAQPGQTEVEGERALLQIMTHMGVGGLFRAPMWHTGMWVTFKPATNTEFVELNRLLAADKIQLGRWSYGLALSNMVVMSQDRVFEFALQHVYNTSIKAEELPIAKLRDWIAPQDIASFIWGFLCACYPSGFQYETSCIQDPSKCNHVIKAVLNLTKLQNTDEAVLTDWQKQHMTSMTPNSKSLDSLKRYREDLTALADKRVLFNKGTKHEIALTLHVPTITQYIEQGYRWVNGIVNSVNAVLGTDASITDRNTEINTLGKATTLCQYSHWVSKIEFGELSEGGEDADQRSSRFITSQETIENTLKSFSLTDSLREAIIDEIKTYINESTFSLIGIPAFDCPACGTPQEGDVPFPRMKSVIPLDLMQVFFGLLSQRLERIDSL